MSIINTMKETLSRILSRFNLIAIKSAELSVTSEMQTHLQLWLQMVTGQAPWNTKYKPCGVLNSISKALGDPIDEEIHVSSQNEELNRIIQDLDSRVTDIVSMMTLSGGCVVRPIISNSKLQFELVRLGDYIPIKYDPDGTLTACMILKTYTEGKKQFCLIEKHEYKERNHSITLEIYRTDASDFKKCSLSDCSQTANLQEYIIWENVEQPFVIEFRNKTLNTIDGSLFPVPIYAGYENLIADADEQYSNIVWEQRAGRTKVFVDEDLLPKERLTDENGGVYSYSVVPSDMKDVIVKIDGNGVDANKITPFSPALRTTQQIEAFNEILRRIETTLNIGKGTLSNMQMDKQTATQFTGGKKALYTTIDTLENEIEKKYKACAYVFAYMASVFMGISFNPEVEISFTDDSRKDPQKMKQELLQELNAGIISPVEYRMKVYGESEEIASSKVPEKQIGSFLM